MTQKQILVLKKTQTQVNNLKLKLISQFYIFIKKSSAATKGRICKDEVWTVKQQAIKAEIIATLKFGSQNIPFSAAEILAMCYQQQFLDSVISKSVIISSNKMSSMVAYGLTPYFTDMTVGELMEGQSYFTLNFDKTVNAQVKRRWICLFDSGQTPTMRSE